MNFLALLSIVCFTSGLFAQRLVTIPLVSQPGEIQADVYGNSARAVILAHGGSFDRGSWKKQAQRLTESGFLVLALSFRGDRHNPDGSPGWSGSYVDNTADVLAAVAYLHHLGVKTISSVGASLGGDAVGDADANSPAGTFDRILFLGSSGGDAPEKLTGRKLFVVAREDRSGSGPRLPDISSHYARAPQPKKLVLLEGSAHAQFLFETNQGARLLDEIVAFLTAP